MSKLLIGLNSFHDLPLLREVLPPLEVLHKKLKAHVVIMDVGWDDEVRDFVQKEYPHFDYQRAPGGNIGYGASYNLILKQNPGYDAFLVVTSDVLLDPDVVETFVKRLEQDESVVMAAGKLHYWNLERKEKTKQIDSLGIRAERRHHFSERGSGELDEGQYDADLQNIFGFTGAMFLIRCSVIPSLHGSAWQLFDERMWMYKEDVDLAYRLRWMGLGMQFYPEVWGWHARTLANRGGQSFWQMAKVHFKQRGRGRRVSYANHLLLLKNHLSWRLGAGVWARVLLFESLKALYMLLTSPRGFFAGLRVLIFERGRPSERGVSAQELLRHFQA